MYTQMIHMPDTYTTVQQYKTVIKVKYNYTTVKFCVMEKYFTLLKFSHLNAN